MSEEVADAQAKVEQARQDLGESLDELTNRVDPRVKAKAAVEKLPEPVKGHERELAIGAGVLVLVLIILRRRTRS